MENRSVDHRSSYGVNAQALVDLMLEMNVINVKDIDAEIAKLAAHVADPRAKSWFLRVPRYWLINIDKLQEPYKAPAVPRDERRGSKYYHEPSSRSDLLWPAWRGEQPENKPNICPKCKGEGITVDDQTGETKRCKTCGGTGLAEKPYAGGNFCPTCRGSGQLKPGPEGTKIPAKRDDPNAETCPTCGGTGLPREKIKKPAGREGFFMGENWLRRLLGEARPKGKLDPNLPGYDPKERTYTTNLHVQPEIIECPNCHGEGTVAGRTCKVCGGSGKTRQRIAKDISQLFTPFKPSKAKAKEIYGGPPTKNELEPWMQEPGAEEKELYHFDPIQVSRKDLFSRLKNLVNFLNFSARSLTRKNVLTPEEAEGLSEEEQAFIINTRKQQAADAKALFDQLRVMKPDDAMAFREVLLKAEEFEYNVINKPELFSIKKSGRVVGRNGNLVIRRCDDVETALICGQKPAFNGIEPKTWCLKNEYNVRSYIGQGPLFFIERDGKAYVAIHPPTNQVKDTQNVAIERALSNAEIEQLVPLVVPQEEITEESLTGEARHLADLVGAARHERRFRR